MQFYCETKNNLTDRFVGPLDEKGWPTIHPMFIVDAKDTKEAQKLLEAKFPNNVLEVIPLDLHSA